MTLAARVADWLDPKRNARASTDPIAFPPNTGTNFGNGIGNQPTHEALLRESRGVFSMGERAIANRVGGLTLEVVAPHRQASGVIEDEKVDDSHPLVQLLANPHPNITKFMLFRLKTQWLTSTGEAHWLKVGNGLGVPTELHPIPPTSIETIWNDGIVSHFVVTDGSGRRKLLDQDKVIHFYFPDPERFWGSEGYLGPSANSADTLKFATETMREYYRNNATPATVLKAGAAFEDPAIRRAFEDAWRASQHRLHGTARGLPAYIPSDADLIEMAMQTGADVVPLLEYFRDEQLMAVGTPRSVLGQVVSGDRSSAEVNQYVFDRYTVKPITELDADALTNQLAVDFDPMLKVRFAEFVSADKEHELKREAQDLTLKVKSINEVREQRGDDTVAWGELPVGTLADSPYDGSGAFDDFPDDDPEALEDRKRVEAATETRDDPRMIKNQAAGERSAARAEFQRQIHREKKYVPGFTSRLRKILKAQRDRAIERLHATEPRARVTSDELFSEEEWRELFAVEIDPFRVRAFRDIVNATLEELDGIKEFVFTEQQAIVLRDQGAALVRHINRTTQRRLADTLAEATLQGESIDQIEKRVRSVFRTRSQQARTIARTEVLKASQTAQITAFETSGVVERKRWNTSLDSNVRDSHAPVNGQGRAIDEPFELGDGEFADAPGIGAFGATLSAGNSINCRCFVTPIIK